MRILTGLALAAGLLLAACASQSNTADRLTLVNNTIASMARVTTTALNQGRIDVETACKVGVYTRLAGAAVDAGFEAYVEGNVESADGHLLAANRILAGTSAEAAAQVEKEC